MQLLLKEVVLKQIRIIVFLILISIKFLVIMDLSRLDLVTCKRKNFLYSEIHAPAQAKNSFFCTFKPEQSSIVLVLVSCK